MTIDTEMITIFSAPTSKEEQRKSQRGYKELIHSASESVSEVAVSTIQNNLEHFLKAIDAMFSTAPKKVGGLELERVEIHAEIDGSGKIGISAIGGAELSARSGIKFVLSRQV